MSARVSRQIERRARFGLALSKMPLWETWTTIQKVDTGFRDVQGERIIEEVKQAHCKTVPRRVRRSMARDLAKREFRNERGLLKN